MSYPFQVSSYRAQCLNVVDGDTVDLLVDMGFRMYTKARFRLTRIDTPELNSKDPEERQRAQEAKQQVVSKLQPAADVEFGAESWDLRIETRKDPDSFGRWLAEVYYTDEEGEHSLNEVLLNLGHAELYRR